MSGYMVSVGDESVIHNILMQMDTVMGDMVSVYKDLSGAQESVAPSWKGDDSSSFSALMDEYYQKAQALKKHAGEVIDPSLKMMRHLAGFHGNVSTARSMS